MDQLELQRVFQVFDLNHDGRITHSELSASLAKLNISMSPKDLAEVLGMVGLNHDGCLDMDEFRVLYKMITESQDDDGDLREAFRVFDRNGDGFITAEELKAVLGLMGVGKAEDCCKKMIRKVDVDGDGRVDFREFRRMMVGGDGGVPFSS